MEGCSTVYGFVAKSMRVGEEVGEEGRCVGVRSVMNHREEILEVSKVQIGKGGFGERLESRTRKRMGRRCWKVRVSDTLLVEDGTVCVYRQSIFQIELELDLGLMKGSTVLLEAGKDSRMSLCRL